MSIIDEINALQRRGVDILRAAHEAVPRELADLTGIPLADARAWVRTAADLLGATRNTRQQADTLADAIRLEHSADTLVMINSYARRVKDPSRRWPLRRELAAIDGDYTTIQRRARQRLEELNRAAEPGTDDAPRARFRHDHERRRTMLSLSVPLETGRRLLASTLALIDDPHPSTEQLGRAFLELLEGDHDLGDITYVRNLIIGLDDAIALEQARTTGADASDILLACDDGTTMTGAEYVNATLAEHGYVGLFSAVDGPINLYHTRRFAEFKQRHLAMLENPVCPWPDCHQPAITSQINHLVEWQHGGGTNPVNLCTACGYHNGVNGLPHRGRLLRHRGRVSWLPPGGGPPRLSEHPANQRGAMNLI
ncbi:HNH endonuclease signature motif containing protein [Corynebacterium uterequi]|uniref:HNH nuclease domain-containing protein n=1 Tax=Corynebacterium uterequi TaxID=1072256 RepID=A0A0G3HAV7_9CORY|nr:HNH endonuclease signature motif containing protein [Corynebacterium uterequi]AKK10496.1 hypothetical protein CUTER_02405 [Corynebacterium uterequi]